MHKPTKSTKPSPKKPTARAAAPSSKAARAPAAKRAQPAAFVTDDAVAAYEHFAAIVRAWPDKTPLERYPGDPEVARYNVQTAHELLSPLYPKLANKLPEQSIPELLELPTLALACVQAPSYIDGAPTQVELTMRLERLRGRREAALTVCEGLAHPALGLLPSEKVAAIRAGKGPSDQARDAGSLKSLLSGKVLTLDGQPVFSKAWLDELAADGNFALANIRPTGAAPPPSTPSEAQVVRDRLWTLLVQRYDKLLSVASVLLGHRVATERVPLLLTRSASSPTPGAAEPAPAPAPVK